MKYLLSIFFFILFLSGCSKKSPESTGNTPPILAGARSVSAEIKSAFEEQVSPDNPLTAKVEVSTVSGNYSDPYASGTITFTGLNATQFNSDVIGKTTYPAGNNNIFLYGCYPAADWTTNNHTAGCTFSGTQDVMYAPQQYSTKESAIAGNYPMLVFSHLLTLLEIRAIAENPAAQSLWGDLTEITLIRGAGKDFANTVQVTLADAEAVPVYGGTLPVWNVFTANDAVFTAQSLSLPVAPQPSRFAAYTMVAPVMATGSNDFTLSLKTSGTDTPVSITNIALNLKDTQGLPFTGNTCGKKFTITLTFCATFIQAGAQVTPWKNGGSADADIDF